MVSVGSRALLLVRHRSSNLVEDSLMGEEGNLYKHGRRKKGMGRKAKRERFGLDGDNSNKNVSARIPDEIVRPRKSKLQNTSGPKPSIIRKQVDPETAKYFSEIANLFESAGVDLEERSVICGNALEEARGKEFELATDYIMSHTLQTLLEGCDADHLCNFLQGCAKVFPLISMDRSGSHVAETALKSLAVHLQDNEVYPTIEETLSVICKVIAVNPVDMMCNCYGSHVLRSLLCLCGGVPLDSSEFHGAKPSTVLAERLNLRASRARGNDSPNFQFIFPDLLKFLVSEMLKCTSQDVKVLQVDQYGSLVLQTALKLLAGHDQELLQIIPILLGCKKENCKKENLMERNIPETMAVGDIGELLRETAYSHLMEVILEVTPKSLYDEMFTKVFRNSLFDLSTHHCGNFVVQALVSHARAQEQMELIWEELGPKFGDLLQTGRSGVIASVIAASQRLHTHERKCCQALAAAVCSPNESPSCIVPRILFLENYFACEDKAKWKWPNGVKMHIMGTLILQEVFQFPSEIIQPYVTSLTSMELDHAFETAKDAGGARVIEAFLGSNASAKQKRRLIMKLQGHFGELAMSSSGSFTIEKCFTASNVSLREAIASDLLGAKAELSKTKQGPFLLRKLDIDGFASGPDQWRSKQASKQSTYKEFYAAFGSSETKPSKSNSFANASKNTSRPNDLKKIREEIDHHLISEKYDTADDIMKVKRKKLKNKEGYVGEASSAATQSASRIPFLSDDTKEKKRRRKDRS